MLNVPSSSERTVTRSYRCAPQVRWAVERRGLTVMDPPRGAFCCIPYPCAALWDLLERGYRTDEAVRMTALVAGMPVDAAQKMVVRALEDWIALGLFLPEGDDG